MKSFVNDCFDCAKTIESNANRISVLAESFHLTGNDKLAEKLYSIFDSLTEQSERVRKICSNKTSQDLKDVQDATGNMLKGMLAVADKKV